MNEHNEPNIVSLRDDAASQAADLGGERRLTVIGSNGEVVAEVAGEQLVQAVETFLSNPEPLDPYEAVRGADVAHQEGLDEETRELCSATRELLARHAAPTSSRGAVTLRASHSMRYARNGVPLTGKLVIVFTPDEHAPTTEGIGLYLEALRPFEGEAEDLAEEIAIALCFAVRVKTVQVSFSYKLYGIERSARAKHKRWA